MLMAREKEQDFLTSGQVARMLGLSSQHVHRLATETGQLPVVARAGKGILLFRHSDVERLAKEREETPPRPGPKPGSKRKKAAKVTKKTTKGRAKKT